MEILNFAQGLPGENVLATFSVYMPDKKLTIHRLRLIRTKKGALFLSWPSYCVQIAESKTFHQFIEFSKEEKPHIDAKILEELRKVYQLS